MRMINARFFLTALLALSLGGCRVKPKAVDAPSASGRDFPHTYPSPATDPAPRGSKAAP